MYKIIFPLIDYQAYVFYASIYSAKDLLINWKPNPFFPKHSDGNMKPLKWNIVKLNHAKSLFLTALFIVCLFNGKYETISGGWYYIEKHPSSSLYVRTHIFKTTNSFVSHFYALISSPYFVDQATTGWICTLH